MTIRIEDLEAGRVDLADIAEPGAAPVPPTRPGEVLQDLIEDLEISPAALARAMHVPASGITAILDGSQPVTADTAIRLGRALGTSAEMWLVLQARHDVELAVQHGVGADVEPIAA